MGAKPMRTAAGIGRLLKIYAKMDLTWFLRDTRFCLLQIATDATVSVANVAGMLMLAARFDGFGGFSQRELLLMLGFALLVNGLYLLIFGNNNAGQISRVIGRGQLDHALIQPIPLWMHFMIHGFAPVSGTGPLICGLALTGYAFIQLKLSIGLLGLLGLALLLGLSLAIFTAWVFGISAIAFWAPYAAEEIAPEVTSLFNTLAPYPLGGLPQLTQMILCTLLPVGTMAYLPVQILLGKTERSGAIALLCAAATAAVALALVIFRKGLRYYAKYSSPRYTGFGR